ncbi:MAG: lysylphosphatidylglycerol synthase transmembrane domain-containing protein [Gaiellales bacterium]
MSEAKPAGRDWKALGRKAVGPAIGLAIVVGIFAAIIPHFADYETVWHYMTNLSTLDWAVIAVCTALNVATSGPPWMAAVPGLSYKRSMLLTQTGLLMTSVLPMGEAVGFGTQITMLRRWRFGPHVVTAGFLLVAVWNQGMNTVIPVASVMLLGAGHANPALYTISLIAAGALVLFVAAAIVAFRSEDQARRIGEFSGRMVSRLWVLMHREPRLGWGDRLANMRSETIDVVSRRWLFLTVSTLANQFTLFGVMLACLHATGVTGVSFVEALAAWAFARLIGSVAITPAGLGIQELGLTAALVAFGGGTNQVIATALLFRVLTFVPTIIVGVVCMVIWRREEHRDAPVAAAAS